MQSTVQSETAPQSLLSHTIVAVHSTTLNYTLSTRHYHHQTNRSHLQTAK